MQTKRVPELHDKDTLQFLCDRLTHREIARLIGCARSSVSNAVSKLGICTRTIPSVGPVVKYDVLMDETAVRILMQHFTEHEIADIVGCSSSRVNVARHRFGIEDRVNRSRKTRQTTYDPAQLDESIAHYTERQACWHKLAKRMLDNKWEGEWCD